MKTRSFVVLSAFVLFVFAVSLACNAVTGAPATKTSVPTNVVVRATEAVSQPTAAPTVESGITPSSSGGFTTFTDQNNYYQMEVPSDWNYSQSTGDYYYIDHFKSPDEKGLIENITYDDGTPFSGSQNGRFALDLLNRFYSNTGTTGDIRVSDDSIMKDGSERLTWRSKSGGYSGISYFELRGRTTFLMITIEWVDSAKDQYFDLLSTVIESYRLP